MDSLWSCLSSFGQVLLSIYKKCILLEFADDALSEKRFNPRVVAALWSLNYRAAGKTRLPTGYCRQTVRCYPFRSVPTTLYRSTGYCSFVTSYAYLCFESSVAFRFCHTSCMTESQNHSKCRMVSRLLPHVPFC